MKKTIGSLCLFFLSQTGFGQEASKLVSYAEDVSYNTENKLNFVRLKADQRIYESELGAFINTMVFTSGINKVSLQKTERDGLGFTHIKFNILQGGALLANKVIIAHCQDGKLVSLNGDLSDIPAAGNTFLLAENKALGLALSKVNAKKYKWENKEEEQHMREVLNQPDFSYYPHGEKVVLEKEGKFYKTYRFNIYAEEPLYRANVFVDAATGKVLDEQNLICHADVPGSAVTKYSGTQTITVDQNGGQFRLKETGRGLGIETYNLKYTANYGSASNFTNNSTNWTTTGADQGATDAHWGAEKTYDYYWTQHNRNSINNNGFKLISYIHYQTNYQNAFWDGQRMTYGDGGGSTKIFTALDICGHEVTHGLTSNTGNLTYSNEPGALNESFSDIFGTAIENYARPGNWNWKIGEDISNSGTTGLRNMSNPGQYGDPDTYGAGSYYTGTNDNGGVHTNSGVSNYWFYLLTMGGSGTNKINNAYSVTGIGMTNAAKIAFRALTVYFTPTTNFASARLLTIQAAKDLFGACSNEVIQTTRAWYAVGVGVNYITSVGPNFTAMNSNFCTSPVVANFINTTLNGVNYTWDFGDGSVSTSTNPSHTYTSPGNYSVKLKATGCAGIDSVTKTAYITVYPPVNPPVASGATVCQNASVVLNGSGSSVIKWYENPTGGFELGTGNAFATPGLTATTTFYAANTFTFGPAFGGILSNAGGGGGQISSNTNYLIFDVLQPGVLNSVVVYAQTISVPHIIQMRNASNQVINSTTVNLSAGPNTVTLNYSLTPGTNYRLGLSTGSPGLYRSISGVTFPYYIGGCVNIKSSNANGAYYYFYNWEVTVPGCSSARVPVEATVTPRPAATIGAPTAPVCKGDMVTVSGTPAGGSYSGNMTGNLYNASEAGTYTISYTVSDGVCSNEAVAALFVQECTGISQLNTESASVSIYPNPAKNDVIINTAVNNGKVNIADASGRLVLTNDLDSSEEHINVSSLSNGMYILSVQDNAGKTVKTVKLIKE